MGIYINRLTLSLFFVLSASNHCLLLCEKYLARLIMVLSHRDRYFRLHFLMDMDSIGYVLLAFSLYLFLLDTLARLVFHKKYSLYSLFIYEYLVLWYINYYMLIFPWLSSNKGVSTTSGDSWSVFLVYRHFPPVL